jgi:iron(III) transport system substrate-binding protein
MKDWIQRSVAFATAAMVIFLAGCGRQGPSVVVYTALDEMYSRPILDAFEKETGIEVRAVYDTEAAKTTGLVTRLIAQQARPRADVFWNNEVAQTIVLKNRGVIEPYLSPSAEAIPSQFKDAEGYWTGFAARGRVIIYNTDVVQGAPTSVRDFLKPEWSGRAAVALPLFGTTATHAAALFALWGDEEAKEFFRGLIANDVAVLAGNATVRDMVARGEYAIGLTDTDDANGAVEDGLPARWLFPDQEEGGIGTLVIPNTVALIKGGPNPDGGMKLIDYLLSPEVEGKLARMRSIQIPLNPAVEAPDNVPNLAKIRTVGVSFDAIAEKMAAAAEFIQKEFVR